MKIYHFCLLILFANTSLLNSAENRNPGCKEEEKATGTSEVTAQLTGVDEKIKSLKTSVTGAINEAANSIRIDEEYIANTIRANSPGILPEVFRERLVSIVRDASAKLIQQKASLAKKVQDSLNASIDSAALMAPQLQFQADFSHCPNKQDENVWSRGGANLVGNTGIGLEGSGDISISAGVSVGVEASVPCNLSFEMKGNFELVEPNPVGPTTGSGKTIRMTATPRWQIIFSRKAGVQVGLKLTVGTSSTFKGTLKNVKATVKL